MCGHGNVVVGDSVKEVVFRVIYTEINAKLEAETLRLGSLRLGQGQRVKQWSSPPHLEPVKTVSV